MSRYNLPKLARYIPLWQRAVPKYPLWFRGGPQLRVMLPLFWMKMIKPRVQGPPNQVQFEVHQQMTKYDVKNYLEKIYSTPVDHVRTYMVRGEEVFHPEQGFLLRREPDRKYAYVWLEKGQKFEFPSLYGSKDSPEEKNAKQMTKISEEMEKVRKSTWQQADVPLWFR